MTTGATVGDERNEEGAPHSGGGTNASKSLRRLLTTAAMNSRLTSLFTKWDVNENQFIEKQEFQRAVLALGFEDRTEIDSIFEELDSDQDGKLSFRDFQQLRKLDPSLSPQRIVRRMVKETAERKKRAASAQRLQAKRDSPKAENALKMLRNKLDSKSLRAIDLFRRFQDGDAVEAARDSWDAKACSISKEQFRKGLAQELGVSKTVCDATYRSIGSLRGNGETSNGRITFEMLKQALPPPTDLARRRAAAAAARTERAEAVLKRQAEADCDIALDILTRVRKRLDRDNLRVVDLFRRWSGGKVYLSFDQFYSGLVAYMNNDMHMVTRQVCGAAYRLFDRKHNGCVTLDQMASVLVELVPVLPKQWRRPRSPRRASPSKAESEEAQQLVMELHLRVQGLRIIDVFNSWDRTKDGSVSKAEFRTGLATLGLQASNEAMEECFDSMDPEKSGSIRLNVLRDKLHIPGHGWPRPPRPPTPPAPVNPHRVELVDTPPMASATKSETQPASAELDKTTSDEEANSSVAPSVMEFQHQVQDEPPNANDQLMLEKLSSMRDAFDQLFGAAELDDLAAELEEDHHFEFDPSKSDEKARSTTPRRARSPRRPTPGTPDAQQLVKELRWRVQSAELRIIDFFNQMDQNRSGCVSKAEFRKGLAALGLEPSQAIFESVFATIDASRSGVIELSELRNKLKHRITPKPPKRKKQLPRSPPPTDELSHIETLLWADDDVPGSLEKTKIRPEYHGDSTHGHKFRHSKPLCSSANGSIRHRDIILANRVLNDAGVHRWTVHVEPCVGSNSSEIRIGVAAADNDEDGHVPAWGFRPHLQGKVFEVDAVSGADYRVAEVLDAEIRNTARYVNVTCEVDLSYGTLAFATDGGPFEVVRNVLLPEAVIPWCCVFHVGDALTLSNYRCSITPSESDVAIPRRFPGWIPSASLLATPISGRTPGGAEPSRALEAPSAPVTAAESENGASPEQPWTDDYHLLDRWRHLQAETATLKAQLEQESKPGYMF